MIDIMKLIDYFLFYDPVNSIKNIIKYHIPFHLFGNIEIQKVKDTFIHLLTPCDTYFRLPEKLLTILYDYLQEANFWNFYVGLFKQFDHNAIYNKIIALNFQNYTEINEKFIDLKNEKIEPNLFTYLFHAFFNKLSIIKNHKQIEDVELDNIDIDRINLKNEEFKSKRRDTVAFFPHSLKKLEINVDNKNVNSMNSEDFSPIKHKNFNTKLGENLPPPISSLGNIDSNGICILDINHIEGIQPVSGKRVNFAHSMNNFDNDPNFIEVYEAQSDSDSQNGLNFRDYTKKLLLDEYSSTKSKHGILDDIIDWILINPIHFKIDN